MQAPAPAPQHMEAVYTALNFVPVLTLAAVVYAAGAFAQRVKGLEANVKELQTKLESLQQRGSRRKPPAEDDD